ncbi:MAG: hypothetical protein C0392_07325 [Syntrophus sp. (in: bacteria)]|nr:hypothetical protein [Syntrophus sp. (in: bacteria)]
MILKYPIIFAFKARRRYDMELFVVMDEMLLGQGVFGVFSTIDKAQAYSEGFELSTKFRCAIKQLTITGHYIFPDSVFVVYTYDDLCDSYIFDGLYSKTLYAHDAAGDRGQVVEFKPDYSDGTR